MMEAPSPPAIRSIVSGHEQDEAYAAFRQAAIRPLKVRGAILEPENTGGADGFCESDSSVLGVRASESVKGLRSAASVFLKCSDGVAEFDKH